MLPALFVSHGSPTLPLDQCAAREFLAGLGKTYERPQAILTISAHWETSAPCVGAPARNRTIHDFYGFPNALYDLRYEPPPAPTLADQVIARLGDANTAATIDRVRGLDHGAWVPLMLMYPEADIPVMQLSVQPQAGVAHHVAIGRALKSLRNDGVLILGSGGFVHNLHAIDWRGGPEPAWSAAFADWVHKKLLARDDAALNDYRTLAPDAVMAHPTEEHFMPLFVASGAGDRAERLHRSVTFASLRMDAYAFF
jgi:4,5-DOPA dioxygenase extradiol